MGGESYDPSGNDLVSSMKVTAECKATLWEHPVESGRVFEATGDVDWIGDDFNDIASEAYCSCQ
ncbi:MAG: hypothetical protein KDG89_14850 [Geminicoccaceae bacterium]|nr:hypothetical protein [Geminicoccaceae bacterium]